MSEREIKVQQAHLFSPISLRVYACDLITKALEILHSFKKRMMLCTFFFLVYYTLKCICFYFHLQWHSAFFYSHVKINAALLTASECLNLLMKQISFWSVKSVHQLNVTCNAFNYFFLIKASCAIRVCYTFTCNIEKKKIMYAVQRRNLAKEIFDELLQQQKFSELAFQKANAERIK